MDMLQAHSFLWSYLWVAPNLLLLVLAALLLRRRIYRVYPYFIAFAIFASLGELINYASDLAPSITGETWWRIFWSVLVVESLLKFALIGEIFTHVFGSYVAVARIGKLLIRGAGIVLVAAAAFSAALTPPDGIFGIISGAHILEQTIYLISAGLLLAIFGLASYFEIQPDRRVYGIALGLGISACVHLATWGLAANAVIPTEKRVILDFVNMGIYNACVLIWFYYLLVPQTRAVTPSTLLPENNLELWNRELERLIHQ
jgi:hypothetical protein